MKCLLRCTYYCYPFQNLAMNYTFYYDQTNFPFSFNTQTHTSYYQKFLKHNIDLLKTGAQDLYFERKAKSHSVPSLF